MTSFHCCDEVLHESKTTAKNLFVEVDALFGVLGWLEGAPRGFEMKRDRIKRHGF